MFTPTQQLKVEDYGGQLVTLVQPKLDGVRLLIQKRSTGFFALTRTGKSDHWPRLRHLEYGLRHMPNNSAIEGELHCEGKQSTEVSHLLTHQPSLLGFRMFAAPLWAGDDLRSMPWADVETLMYGWEMSWMLVDTIQRSNPLVLNVEYWQQRALDAGIEGYVGKVEHYEGWYRIKPVKTVDVVVITSAVSDSNSYRGGLKSIQVGLWEEGELKYLCSVGSGFSKEYRMSVDMPSLNGRVAEVEYDCVAANGSLRFPRFVRWRDDKPANECTKDQL